MSRKARQAKKQQAQDLLKRQVRRQVRQSLSKLKMRCGFMTMLRENERNRLWQDYTTVE